MKRKFENLIALSLSALLAVPLPVFARGFGGGGGGHFGGGGFGGGHSFGGGGFGGGHSFGGGGFGGSHSFGGGGFGGSHSFGGGFGGGDGFGGSHGFGGGEGFAGSHGFGGGSGFGGEHGFSGGQGFAGNHGMGTGSGFGGNSGFGNHGTGFGGNSGFGSGGGFAGNHGMGNRPGFDGFGGNGAHNSGFGNGSFSGNHPNFDHFPNQGGFNGISGNLNHTPHNFTQNQLNDQGKSIRNSFNNTTVNNFNHYGNNFNHYGNNWNGYHNGYWHGYANGFYHGSWAYPGSWFCPMWSEGAAWTFMGVSALTSFLGLAMIASGTHHGNNNNGGGNVTNITYEGDNVYINGQPNCSAAQYYTQAQNLAAQAYTQPNTSSYSDFYDGFPNNGQPTSTQTDADEKWEPLGVFALAEPGETQSNMLLQLAINQAGIVRGNYMNQLTDEKSQVYGALDKKTQRISWTIGQNKNTVFDTSLGTLCENDSQVLVHYGPNNTQEMALIRLSQNGSGSDKDMNKSTSTDTPTPVTAG